MKKKNLGKSALTTALVYGTMSFFGTIASAEESTAEETGSVSQEAVEQIASVEESTAEETPMEFSLDTMVVTATRTLKELQQVPSSVSVITAQEIEEKNAMSVKEALQNVPGLYMDQTALGGIQLRGFNSDDILILVDGMQMNTTYAGTAELSSIPVENIERIEVLRGAASSIYGGYAVGGVINIITKEADKIGTTVNGAVSYGSDNTWKKAIQVNSKVNDKWSFGLGYEDRKSDGYPGYYITKRKGSGKGTYSANLQQLGNGYYVAGTRGDKYWDHENYNVFVKYNFDDNKSLKYAYGKTKSNNSYANGQSFVTDAAGNPVYSGRVTTQTGDVISLSTGDFYGYDNWYEKDTHSLTYRDDENKFTASASYVDNKEHGFTSPSVPTNYNKLDWTGAGSYSSHPGSVVNYSLEKAWEKVGKHTIVAGANYKEEEMTQDNFTLGNWRDTNSITGHTGRDHGKVKNMALFVQDEYKFDEAWTMYLGLRLDHYKKGAGSFMKDSGNIHMTSKSETYNELSPKVAFDFKADDSTNYFVSYGHSFRPPTMYKLYRYSQFSSYWYVPNPELKPEISDTFEVGMKKRLSDKTNLGVTLYHIKTDDKIEASGVIPGESFMGKGVKKYLNMSAERRRGVELELTHKFSDKFNGYINYAWQHGKVEPKSGAEYNDYNIPKHLLHAGIGYNYKKWNATLDCQYVSERQSPDAVTGEYGAEDAYFLMNAAVNYRFTKEMTLQLGVNNLFNRHFYSSEATSGRTYYVGMRFNF